MSIVIYPYPGACSRVTMDALETIGLDYEDRCVNIAKAAQKDPDYLALNPKGKVPTMVFEGTTMTENAAKQAKSNAKAGLAEIRKEETIQRQKLKDLKQQVKDEQKLLDKLKKGP